METLIKVDNKFINLANVTEIHSYELDGWNVIVYYTSVTRDEDGNLLQDFEHFTGEEAEALRFWLEQNAADVLAWYQNASKQRERILYMHDPERKSSAM